MAALNILGISAAKTRSIEIPQNPFPFFCGPALLLANCIPIEFAFCKTGRGNFDDALTPTVSRDVKYDEVFPKL
jgi:hypothetical protein